MTHRHASTKCSLRLGSVFLLLLFLVACSSTPLSAWDDWDDWGDADSGPTIKRPFVTGWWNWQYNSFSSFDQGRITFEKEYDRNNKLIFGFNFNHYTEDDHKKWELFPGENYYSFRLSDVDFRAGLLVENIGSGDNFSFVDKINSRRFINGLANDFDRDKKEVPAIRGTWYINDKWRFSGNYMPYFTASDFPSMFGQWGYAIQRSVANEVVFNNAVYNAPDDSSFDPQFHVELGATYPDFELRLHYLHLKERLPVISRDKPKVLNGTYPLDETFAANGSVKLASDFIMRYELAYSRNRTWSSYENATIGKKFNSDHIGLLLGADRNLPQNFYINVQAMVSHVPDLLTQTPLQLESTEYLASLQMRQTFRRERVAVEFNSLANLTTGEYVLTPQVHLVQSDFLTFVAGLQVNGEGAEAFGPVGQFSNNDTAFFETRVRF